MKRFIVFFLTVVLMCSLFTGVASATSDTNTSRELHLSGTPSSSDINELASQHLMTMKANLAFNPAAFGFNSTELSSLTLGGPFTIYNFDENSQLVSNDVYAFPLIYLNEIVGIIEVYYDTSTSNYSFTFGKSYGEKLNELRNDRSFGADTNLVIGRIGDKLFATDGNNVKILLDKQAQGATAVTKEQIESLCDVFTTLTSPNYITVTEPISQATSENKDFPDAVARAYPNPLPVPHVEQTGTCGVAAWAAVLNYRFDTSYTNDSLETEMIDGGYNHGTDGIPNMTDYRDFANDEYDGECVFSSSPPSFSKLKSTINGGRPIMGSWYSGATKGKVYHAIIITGYVENSSSNYTYVLKNPWYEDTQTITVTSASSVIYADAGYTWNLSQIVY
jgi:hypothetical protein